MADSEGDGLQQRLRNCLQTILELEPDLERLEMGEMLMKEFQVLKSFIQRLGQVDVVEDDVARIESATANFLDELRTPLSLSEETRSKDRLVH
jgi:hypothetical protein